MSKSNMIIMGMALTFILVSFIVLSNNNVIPINMYFAISIASFLFSIGGFFSSSLATIWMFIKLLLLILNMHLLSRYSNEMAGRSENGLGFESQYKTFKLLIYLYKRLSTNLMHFLPKKNKSRIATICYAIAPTLFVLSLIFPPVDYVGIDAITSIRNFVGVFPFGLLLLNISISSEYDNWNAILKGKMVDVQKKIDISQELTAKAIAKKQATRNIASL